MSNHLIPCQLAPFIYLFDAKSEDNVMLMSKIMYAVQIIDKETLLYMDFAVGTLGLLRF